MSIIIEMAPYLRPFIKNNIEVEVNGATVRDCLNGLISQFPDIQDWLFDDHEILKVVLIINRRIVFQKDIDSNISDNDRIRIIMPLGGG